MLVYVVTSPGATEWRFSLTEATRQFETQLDVYGSAVGLYSLDLPKSLVEDPDGAAVDFCDKEVAEGAATLLKGEGY